ncbi:MAG: hypothetical protein ACYC3X_31965, partial [Pirellulaceae bacterium]
STDACYTIMGPDGTGYPSYVTDPVENLQRYGIDISTWFVGAQAGRIIGQLAAPEATVSNRADLHMQLREEGYTYHGTTKGGYVRYRLLDGPDVWIRPNGEVIRLGPKVTPADGGKPYPLRIDANGNVLNNHNPGDFVDPLPGHGG